MGMPGNITDLIIPKNLLLRDLAKKAAKRKLSTQPYIVSQAE
jgi:hypothetical protein